MKLYHCGRHCWRRTQLLKNQFHKKKVNRAKSKGFIKFEREERGRGGEAGYETIYGDSMFLRVCWHGGADHRGQAPWDSL